MARNPHVVLVVETAIVYGRRILHGITRFLRSHPAWSVFLEQHELDAAPPRWLHRWRGDGIITRSAVPGLVSAIRRGHVPAVDLNDRQPPYGAPRINSDDDAIGRLAADHLRERGFQSFAFCGFTGELWSARRRAAFEGAIRAAGLPCQTFDSAWYGPRAHPWENEQAQIGRWLGSLPRPVGVMACNDIRGQHVLDACRRVGLKVPDEAAVVGVDDDELLCELSTPPLSSVIPNAERVGYEAAALLDRLMSGQRPGPVETHIPPLGVATRLSSDVLAIDDPATAEAVRFIRQNACRGIAVADETGDLQAGKEMQVFLGRLPRRG